MTQHDVQAVAGSDSAPWYSGLTRKHWRVLWGSYLGWIFDGYEAFALILALPPALNSLLTPEQVASSGAIYAGLAIGITLLGWGIGGLAGGVLADYFGRKRTMVIAVFFYALLTGITAFSTSLTMLIAMRFLTGLAIGAEWSTGIALVAESWPDKARPKGLGLLQSAFGAGAVMAAVIWFFLNMYQPLGSETWRLLFVIGALPGLCVFYLMRALEESERWLTAVREKRWDAIEGQARERGRERGKAPLHDDLAVPFGRSAAQIVAHLPVVARNDHGLVGGVDVVSGLCRAIGGGAGRTREAFGARASRLSIRWADGSPIWRRASSPMRWGAGSICLLLFAGSLLITWATYLWTGDLWTFSVLAFLNGVITLGFGFSWMAIYPVELFTSSVRSTAASVVFNGARLIAWVFPIIAGTLVANFGGITNAALIISSIYAIGLFVPWFLPETVGKPLPQ